MGNRNMGVLFGVNTPTNSNEQKGIIGRVFEDGLPVIYRFENEMPPASVREQLPWLTVISWKYDGASKNGMPRDDENQKMIQLEDTIENTLEDDQILRHAYCRTGNNLKELVYYIHDRNQFLAKFNTVFASHPRYPIHIAFYEDRDWNDFKKLLDDFTQK